jgi:hypothetical protein
VRREGGAPPATAQRSKNGGRVPRFQRLRNLPAIAVRYPLSLSSGCSGTGTYQIRLLLDDGYRSAAVSAPFKIVQP